MNAQLPQPKQSQQTLARNVRLQDVPGVLNGVFGEMSGDDESRNDLFNDYLNNDSLGAKISASENLGSGYRPHYIPDQGAVMDAIVQD